MKLLMENWRQYINESEKAAHYGDLYLFEDDEVSKTSFYDAINMLSESDEASATFLENWERSVDHMFGSLDEAVPIHTGVEGVDDAILKASTQAYMALNKMKGKAFGSVMNVVKKMKGFAEKNPKTAKAVGLIGQALIAAAAAAAVLSALDAGASAAGGSGATIADRVLDAAQQVSADLVDSTTEILQDLEGNAPRNQAATEPIAPKDFYNWGFDPGRGIAISPEEMAQRAAQKAQELEKMNDVVSQAINDPGLEQAMSGWENEFTDMMRDAGADAEATAGIGAPTGGIDWQSMNPGIDAGVYDKYGPYGEEILGWKADAAGEDPIKQQALERTAREWARFKEMAETFESGQNLEDLDMSRGDFKKWASDAVWAPRRADSILKRAAFRLDAGEGGIPPKYMQWLRRLMRASLKA